MTIRRYIILCIILIGIAPIPARSQEQAKAANAEAVAKQLANPLSNLISVPFQSNVDYGIGPFHGARYIMNFQPVAPVPLSDKVILITRYIIPVVDQNSISGEGRRETGLSDALASGFFSPAHPKNGFIWGVGPALLFPTGTKDLLSTRKWSAGPTVIIVKQLKSWTCGFITNQLWSFAGDEHRANVNQFYFQTFLVYNWQSGAGVNLNSESTFDWQTNTTTVTLIPVITGVTKLGKQIVSLAVGPRIPTIGPNYVIPNFGLRGVITLVFPEG